MTTSTYSTTWAHVDSPSFRLWGSKLSAALQACGLLQTADTGQINWTTVAYSNTASFSSGYEIYQFTDELQATSPVFIRIDYGTGNQPGVATGSPSIWVTVGTGTDGAGNLTGVVSTQEQITGLGSAQQISSNTLPYPTYISFNGSYLGVVHKLNGTNWPGDGYTWSGGVFMVGRGTNTAGQYVAGEVVFACSTPNNGPPPQAIVQCMNTANGLITTSSNGSFTCAWYSPTSTSVNGSNFQVYPCWGAFNQVEPINWMLLGLNAEVGQGTTVLATPFGTTQHTYLMTGAATYNWGINANSNYSILMLWE